MQPTLCISINFQTFAWRIAARIGYYRNHHRLKYAHKCYNVRIPSIKPGQCCKVWGWFFFPIRLYETGEDVVENKKPQCRLQCGLRNFHDVPVLLKYRPTGKSKALANVSVVRFTKGAHSFQQILWIALLRI